ncbi:unnamed protein product [Sympodiomycopsis kandeliae]
MTHSTHTRVWIGKRRCQNKDCRTCTVPYSVQLSHDWEMGLARASFDSQSHFITVQSVRAVPWTVTLPGHSHSGQGQQKQLGPIAKSNSLP